MVHIGVPQSPDDKWHIPVEEYPYRYYPTYCEGFGYLLPSGTAWKLLHMAAYVPYFWIDDVDLRDGVFTPPSPYAAHENCSGTRGYPDDTTPNKGPYQKQHHVLGQKFHFFH